MWTYAVVKDKVLSKTRSKKADIMYRIKILRDKLGLDCSVVTFDEAIGLRAVGIAEVMRDLLFLEFFIKVTQEF